MYAHLLVSVLVLVLGLALDLERARVHEVGYSMAGCPGNRRHSTDSGGDAGGKLSGGVGKGKRYGVQAWRELSRSRQIVPTLERVCVQVFVQVLILALVLVSMLISVVALLDLD